MVSDFVRMSKRDSAFHTKNVFGIGDAAVSALKYSLKRPKTEQLSGNEQD